MSTAKTCGWRCGFSGAHRTALKNSRASLSLSSAAPPDMPHHRSAAALHVVLSGFGAETADGATTVKSPGSVSFEPAPLVYQWSNPGNLPLTYLVFNVNGESEDAVVAAGQNGGQR